MKITIETPGAGEEDEIILRLANVDNNVLNLIYALKGDQTELTGYMDERIVKLSLKEIFYFDSVDNKVFAYTGKNVYEIHKKLYELEALCTNSDFLRVSKSVILNLSKIGYVKPILNGRFEAKLKNGEAIVISRQYVSHLKDKLGI